MTYQQAMEHPSIRYATSYTRLAAVMALRPSMNDAAWYRLLGEEWSGCDNICTCIETLIMEFTTSPLPIRNMMTPAERKAYDALPEEITVYRGCGEHNIQGLSWSVRRQIAERFPFLSRYQVQEPLLVTVKVNKADVVAVKLDRDEAELIICPDDVQVYTVEPLPLLHTMSR